MDQCGYCQYMVPSGVDHYCQEELLEEIEDLIKKFEDFYPEKEEMVISVAALHLAEREIKDDDTWWKRTKEFCENRYGLWK